ncbi:MAG: hypothetical protein PV358_05685 [Acidimicrobiales bacterium]|nr:hypothetical protein [Acidimicrobiales bacterium]
MGDAQGDDVDQLASALLDGDLSLDHPAHQRTEVVARAAELGAARATMRDVGAADPAARERALAAALAAFDEEAPRPSASPDRPPPPVDARGPVLVPAPRPPQPVDLAAQRRSRAGRQGGRQSLPRWLGAAAAAVVVLAGLVGLAALTSDTDDADTAMDTGAGETRESSGGDDELGTAAEDSAEAPSAAEPDESEAHRTAVEAGDLGMFPTGDALVDHLRASVGDNGDNGTDGDNGADLDLEPDAGAPSGDASNSLGSFAACAGAPPPPLDDPDATLVLHGRAVVDDEAVDVWAIDTDRGRRVVAIDDTCELVLDRPIR